MLVSVSAPTIVWVAPWPPKLAESTDAWQTAGAEWAEAADATNASTTAVTAAAPPKRRDPMPSLVGISSVDILAPAGPPHFPEQPAPP